MAYDNEKTGALFERVNKPTENHPDFSGMVTIDGKEWSLAGWKKVKGDKRYLSLKVSDPKDYPKKESKAEGDGGGW